MYNRTAEIIILSLILMSFIAFISSTPSDDPFFWGYSTIWWRLNLWIFILWWLIISTAIYPLLWILFRDIFFLRALVKFYKTFELRPKILHPDGCNGLCGVGDYSIKVTIVIIVLGMWVAYFIVFPFIVGDPGNNRNNFGLDTGMMLFTYVVLAPLSFWLPVWQTHKAMVLAKEKVLEEVARRIRKILADVDNFTEDKNRDLHLLYDYYSFIQKYQKTWPFRPVIAGGFNISMLLPFLSTVFSLWAEWYHPL